MKVNDFYFGKINNDFNKIVIDFNFYLKKLKLWKPSLEKLITRSLDIVMDLKTLEKSDWFDSHMIVEDTDQELLALVDRNYEKIKIYFEARRFALQQREKRFAVSLLAKSKDGRKVEGEWVWLTVNPSPDMPYEAFILACHNAFKCKLFSEGTYVFEQRGTQIGDYKGLHCHALLKRKHAPSHVTRELQRKFTSYVGNIKDPHHFNLQYVESDVLPVLRSYMDGNKGTEEKLEKVKNDANFRKEYKLEESYACGVSSLFKPRIGLKKLIL